MLTENLDTTRNNPKRMLVVFGIYLSVFINSYVFFKEPFEFHIGYIIYLLLLPGYMLRYGVNRNLFFIFLVLLVTGLFQVFIGNNTIELFFKVFLGLMLSYFFYNYVVIDFKFDVEQLFKWYLTGAYIVSLLGIFQIASYKIGFIPGYTFGGLLNKWSISPGGFLGLRINSIFAEPTHLAAVLSAAFFVSVYNIYRKEPFHLSRFKSIVIVAVYCLSFSGLGQTGIFLTLIFLAVSFGLVRYIILAIPAAIFLFYFLYNEVPEFRQRYDGLTGLFKGQKFQLGKTHGSSFILYNNYVVATKNFESNFVFGTGIGSHPVAFEKYSLAKEIKTEGFANNSADANSMFLRLVSETGIFGVGIFMFIVFRCYVRRQPDEESNHWLISNAILIMILLNLFRQGHYFLNGFPFFLIMYYYNHASYKLYSEQRGQESLLGTEQAVSEATHPG